VFEPFSASVPAPAFIDKAYRLFQLPQGMFAIAVGTVLFPTLSRLAASGRFDEFRESLSEGVRQVVFVTLPFTAFFVVLAFPTVRLVYQHGSLVTTEQTWQVTKALIFFSPGMVFVSATTLLTRAFYGIQKTWVPLVVGLANLALNGILDLLLYKPLGVGGITLSTSLVSAFYFSALLILLSREIGGVHARAILGSAAKALVALVPLTVVGYGAWWGVQRALDSSAHPSNQSQIVAVVCGYALGGASYLGAAWLLRMDEPRQLLAVVRRRRSKRDAGPVLEAEERVD
jgi:putative peptidoglycan lipid II flippase